MARRAPVVRRFLRRDGAVDERGRGTCGSSSRCPASRPGSVGCPTAGCWWWPASPAPCTGSEPTAGSSSTGTSTRRPGSTATTWSSTAAGRAYVGNFGFDLDGFIEERGQAALVEPPGPPTTALIRIDPDGSAHIAAEDMSFPNGAVITPDGKTLIVAETLAGRLTAFDVGRRRGAHRAPGMGHALVVRARRDLSRRRRQRVGGQCHHQRVHAGGRGRRGHRPGHHLPDSFACMLGG